MESTKFERTKMHILFRCPGLHKYFALIIVESITVFLFNADFGAIATNIRVFVVLVIIFWNMTTYHYGFWLKYSNRNFSSFFSLPLYCITLVHFAMDFSFLFWHSFFVVVACNNKKFKLNVCEVKLKCFSICCSPGKIPFFFSSYFDTFFVTYSDQQWIWAG